MPHRNLSLNETLAALAEGPVFVLIRFPLSRFHAAKNSLAKNFSIHKAYLGAVAGLSKEVQTLEGEWPYNKGVAMMSFRSFKEAELWRNSVPEIRQQDWLDGVDLIIVPAQRLPDVGKKFVQILEINFRDMNEFMMEYSGQANKHMDTHDADGGVVATDYIYKVKGQWNPQFLIVNFWPSAEVFDSAYNSEDYQPIKMKRLLCSDTNSIIFELTPPFREF